MVLRQERKHLRSTIPPVAGVDAASGEAGLEAGVGAAGAEPRRGQHHDGRAREHALEPAAGHHERGDRGGAGVPDL